MGGFKTFRQGGGLDVVFFVFNFSQQRTSQRAVRTSLEKRLDPEGPIASRGVRISIYEDSIATCDFSGGWGLDPMSPPSESANALKESLIYYFQIVCAPSVYEGSVLPEQYIMFGSMPIFRCSWELKMILYTIYESK